MKYFRFRVRTRKNNIENTLLHLSIQNLRIAALNVDIFDIYKHI